MKRVTVIRGGISSERDVSLKSGENVIKALRQKDYRVSDLIANDDLENIIQLLRSQKPNVVFNALHGRFGEDGAIQGVLEWLNIPYTHSRICASAMGMNKVVTRTLLAESGLPVAKGKVVSFDKFLECDPFAVPYVVKPIEEGSSVGVHLVQSKSPKERQEQRQHILNNWHYGDKILVEEFIPGKELTVCVCNDEALTVTEIASKNHIFYDYEAKYKTGESKHTLPAKIHPNAFEQALNYAVSAHNILGCSPVSRTDFRYDDQNEKENKPGKLYILEVNTHPGMTETSLLPEQAAFRGTTYPYLCSWLVENAKCRT
ncbi:D-alanine--D-alanine ligase B [Commensalibacter sp. Nvir]|uniref:D-alanine--D-alanine ligase n=1 Tax=Commensalibacter sp. Nvir TaxID=3069817 RepID=UPI002D61D8B0|nr:D-alanine--D-alanine ligase B [Commensalibacter sp. Nvir]